MCTMVFTEIMIGFKERLHIQFKHINQYNNNTNNVQKSWRRRLNRLWPVFCPGKVYIILFLSPHPLLHFVLKFDFLTTFSLFIYFLMDLITFVNTPLRCQRFTFYYCLTKGCDYCESELLLILLWYFCIDYKIL